MGMWLNLLGTVETSFSIGKAKATINASALTAPRSFALNDVSGTFYTYDANNPSFTLTGATVTTSAPVANVTQTWNNAAVDFTAKKTNITNTASGAGSLLEDWQVGGVSLLQARKDGSLSTGVGGGFYPYNTAINSTNYERAFSRWASNVYEIGIEALGIGAARQIWIGKTSVGYGGIRLETDGKTTIYPATGDTAQTVSLHTSYGSLIATAYNGSGLTFSAYNSELGGTGTTTKLTTFTNFGSSAVILIKAASPTNNDLDGGPVNVQGQDGSTISGTTRSGGAVNISGGFASGTGVHGAVNLAYTGSAAQGSIKAWAPIKLAGATSGEATISAPAVAGTTALTLPGTSGTLALTSQVANGIILNTTEVSLGSNLKRSGSFTIAGTGLSVGKPVLITKAVGPYTGKGTLADESEMDAITVSASILDASTIKAFWSSATRVRGNHKFNYQVSA